MRSFGSSVAFLKRGDTRAVLKAQGNTPVVINKFTMSTMTGAKVEMLFFNRSVGIGSNLYDLLAVLLISFAVVGRKSDRHDETPRGSSGHIAAGLSWSSKSRRIICSVK